MAMAAITSLPRLATAQPSPPSGDGPVDPARVQGLVRPAVEEGDGARSVASALLFLPREAVRLMFLAGGVTAGLVRDEQVVPRVGELLSPSPGNISFVPSLFLDTRRRTSVGAQLLASGRESGTRLSFGFGGSHDLLGEARGRFGFARPIPFVVSVEGLADARSTLDFLGVGQKPETDPRNIFRRGVDARAATYFEQRVRAIASIGARVAPDWEVFISGSFTRSRVADTPTAPPDTISRVFAPGTVAGAPAFTTWCPAARNALPCATESRIFYTELALRLDTRPTAGRPSDGVLVESYAGIANAAGHDRTRFYRVGGRAAMFIPILRPTNILSPKVALDGMIVPPGTPEPPFTALVHQPDYRGFDNRIDRLSLVVSLDYRFSVVRFFGARLFVDVATVGPDIGAMLDAPKRVAGGFGLELFSSSTQIADMTVSVSGEGPRAYLTFGVPTLFGDRQHRR